MVGLVDLDSVETRATSTVVAEQAPHTGDQAMVNSDSGDMGNVDMCANDSSDLDASTSFQQDDAGAAAAKLKRLQQQQQQQQQQKQSNPVKQTSNDALVSAVANVDQESTTKMSSIDQDLIMDDMDEEQLRRILSCKRLSEGCNRFNVSNMVCRKNSLHMMGESLAPVTEGEPMRHMSHHVSQNIESTSSSSVSSGSSRSATGRHLGGMHISKRNSQDDNTTSCSSSTSLDGPRSPNHRRSSTVSQCSSVLSEGTRQQLNFDLSPDLAPDSSILEANAISPTDFERPASPEPSSLGSGDGSFDMRPISRLSSQCCDEIMLAASPDSTLGDSNENSNPESSVCQEGRPPEGGCNQEANNSETQKRVADCEKHEAAIRDNLERIISHVSTVKVSSTNRLDEQTNRQEQLTQINGQKRAHTPFGANLQRNKTSLISSSPSPTPHETARG